MMTVFFKNFFVVINLFFIVESYCYSRRTKLVVDQDGGADDAMAMFIALLREEYFKGPEILGITTTHGNVNESQCFINTQKVLDVADRRDVPIYRGSKNALIRGYPTDNYFGHDGLGDNKDMDYRAIRAQPQYAAFILLELSKKYKDELIVVTLGPLTNIALAIRIDPDFINRLQHLYVGAGTINDSSNTKPEYNVLHDVEAFNIVEQVARPDKVTMSPHSRIKETTNISSDWRKNELGAIDTRIMKAQNSFEEVSLPKKKKWTLLDPNVMAAALSNDVVETTKYGNIRTALCGEERGINTYDFTSDNPNVNTAYSINEKAYKNFLLETFSADKRSNRR